MRINAGPEIAPATAIPAALISGHHPVDAADHVTKPAKAATKITSMIAAPVGSLPANAATIPDTTTIALKIQLRPLPSMNNKYSRS